MSLKLSPDAVQVIKAGLRWLYDTEQPSGAILQSHGYSYQAGGIMYRFSGRWFNTRSRPVIVLERVKPSYDHIGQLLNPLTIEELIPVSILLDQLGHPAGSFWNPATPVSTHSTTGLFGLTDPAHPSLLAAIARYEEGCPDHNNSAFCGQGGQPDCVWWKAGNAKAVTPTWPDRVSG